MNFVAANILSFPMFKVKSEDALPYEEESLEMNSIKNFTLKLSQRELRPRDEEWGMTGLNCQRVTRPCSFKINLNILQQLWWKDCSLCLEGIHLIKDFEDTWLLILICHDISFYWAVSRNIVQRSQAAITHQINSKRSRKDMNWSG